MSFVSLVNIQNPAFVPTGAFEKIATEVARAAIPALTAARAASPRAFSYIPGGDGLDYASAYADRIWDEVMQLTGSGNYAAPNLNLPPGTPLVWGSTVTTFSGATPNTNNAGILLAPPTPTQVDFYTPVRSGVRLANPAFARFEYQIDASDASGNPITVAVSGNYSYFTATPGSLDKFVVQVNDAGVFIPANSVGLGVVPSAGPIEEVLPITLSVPAIAGIAPFPGDWPYVAIEPSRLPSRPVPLLPAPSVPQPLRRQLPPIFLFPDGVQVGINSPTDRITVIPSELLNRYNAPATEAPLWPAPPGTSICVGAPEPPGDCCSCDDIRDIVFEELDKKFPPKRPTSANATVYATANSRNINLPQFSTSIKLTLVDVPVNAKRQFGNDAPDVVYAGWYAFGVGGASGERIPVNYQDIEIPVPARCDTFSYTLYDGFTASVIVKFLEEAP